MKLLPIVVSLLAVVNAGEMWLKGEEVGVNFTVSVLDDHYLAVSLESAEYMENKFISIGFSQSCNMSESAIISCEYQPPAEDGSDMGGHRVRTYYGKKGPGDFPLAANLTLTGMGAEAENGRCCFNVVRNMEMLGVDGTPTIKTDEPFYVLLARGDLDAERKTFYHFANRQVGPRVSVEEQAVVLAEHEDAVCGTQ